MQDTKTEKPQILSAKTEKLEPKIGQIRKTENPSAPPFKMIRQNTKWNKYKDDSLSSP